MLPFSTSLLAILSWVFCVINNCGADSISTWRRTRAGARRRPFCHPASLMQNISTNYSTDKATTQNFLQAWFKAGCAWNIMSCTTVPILVLEAQSLRSQQVLTCRICQNPCYTLYIPCIVIHPCKITYTSKDEKTSLNMAPAVKGFILTWKKVYPTDFIFASMLQIIGHTLEGSMSNGPNHQNLQNTSKYCIFFFGWHGPLQTWVSTLIFC